MFKFSLQRVLEYRRQVREAIENEMRSLRSRLDDEGLKLEERRRELDAWARFLKELGRDKEADAREISMVYRYMEALRERIRKHQQVIEELKGELEKKREQLVAASQREKIMERLKEREWRAYLAAYAKRENALLDEIAIRSYHHAQAE